MVLLPLDDFSRSSRHFGEQLSIRKLSVNRGWGMLQHMQSTVFLGNPVVGKIQSWSWQRSSCRKTYNEHGYRKGPPNSMFVGLLPHLTKPITGWWYTYPSEKMMEFVSWDDKIKFPTVSGKSFKISWFHYWLLYHNIPLYPIKNTIISH